MTKANTYAASDSSSSSSSSAGSIVVSKEPIDSAYAKAHGLESAGTIQIEEDTDSKGNKYGRAEYHFNISKGKVDFGAYSSGFFRF